MKRHCITELMYHLVLTAKYRKPFWIPDDIIQKAIHSAKMTVHEWVNDKDHLASAYRNLANCKHLQSYRNLQNPDIPPYASKLLQRLGSLVSWLSYHYCRSRERCCRRVHPKAFQVIFPHLPPFGEGLRVGVLA
jgi:hypothetical protein